MVQLFKLAILFVVWFQYTESFAQKLRSFHSEPYRLAMTIRQHNSTFQFWYGMSDSTRNKLVIERIRMGKKKVLYADFIPEGLCSIIDMNEDGYKDFVTHYHDYEVTYFFNTKTNGFLPTPVYTPQQHGILDKQHRLFWGNRDAEYGEAYASSILYTFSGFDTYCYYQLRYITKETYEGRAAAIRVELYRFQKGHYAKPVFIKQIKTNHPGNFDEQHYWQRHYRELLGYR